MTDQEIIRSFIENNQKGIREVYYAWRMPFEQSISLRTHLDMNYMDDAYQEAFVRLQQHILTERLTEENVQSSLLAYIKEIGYYVALEIIHKRRELPISQLNNCDEEESNDRDEVDDSDMSVQEEGYFDPSHYMDVEERERVIRGLIDEIGVPCAPLLLGRLWENKSMSKEKSMQTQLYRVSDCHQTIRRAQKEGKNKDLQ